MPDQIDDIDSIFDEALEAETSDESVDDVGDGDDNVSDETNVSNDEDGTGDEDNPPDDESDTDNAPSDFNWTDHKDELVEVKIGGVPTKVPLGEALNGYLRQEDYTRKTQAVAQDRQYSEWAKNLKQALEADPASVVKTLADAYGVSLAEDEDDYEDDDPRYSKLKGTLSSTQSQLRKIQESQQEIQQERVMNQVRQEIADVQAKYPDFVPEEILPIALERGLQVEDAYLWYQGFKAQNALKSQAEATRRATERAALEAAKRKNQKKIQKPNGLSASPSDKDDASFDTFEEMFAFEIEKSKQPA